MLRKFLLLAGAVNLAFANDSLIIKYKLTAVQNTALKLRVISTDNLREQQMTQPLAADSLQKISQLAGIQLQETARAATGAHLLQLEHSVSASQLQKIIQNIQSDPSVDYVVENRTVYALGLTIPVLNESQWDMQMVSTNPNPVFLGWMGDNLQGAWVNEYGLQQYPGTGVVVAVLDTGYTPHQNFVDSGGTWHLVGYSNVSQTSGYTFLNSGVNYHPDALDTGTYGDCGSGNESSDWHGTHVTGTIIAQGFDGESGVKGGAFGAQVLPIRVLGTCGSGSTYDIINGMMWAAGYSVPGPGSTIIPGSNTPANVLSMSLGTSVGGCDSGTQNAIDIITNYGQNGIIVVAAAGNQAQNVNNVAPGGCNYVISVAAKGPTNALTFYSNYGNTTITASGGDGGANGDRTNLESEVLSTLWSSTGAYQSPTNGGYGIYGAYEGTSQATPHVAATVADMIGILQSSSTPWNYSTIVQMLQQTAGNLNDACNNNPAWVDGYGGGCVKVNSSLNAGDAISLAITNPPLPVPPSNISSGGGGCSVIEDGDDYSLILMLVLSSGIYFCRKKVIKKIG